MAEGATGTPVNGRRGFVGGDGGGGYYADVLVSSSVSTTPVSVDGTATAVGVGGAGRLWFFFTDSFTGDNRGSASLCVE